MIRRLLFLASVGVVMAAVILLSEDPSQAAVRSLNGRPGATTSAPLISPGRPAPSEPETTSVPETLADPHYPQAAADPAVEGRRAAGRVLVTGASGFLGSHLVQRLSEAGLEVHAVSRTKRESDERGVRWWQVDLTDLYDVRDMFQAVRPDTVFNLAGLASGARDLALVPNTFYGNLATAMNLLTVAAETGVGRVILNKSLLEPEQEDIHSAAPSPYVASKWAASVYAQMCHELYKVPIVSLRVFMVYGPGQLDLGKVVPHAVVSLLAGEAPEFSSGRQELDWVYVEDVVDGFLAAATAESVHGQTLDLGSGRLSSVRGVVERVTALSGSAVQPVFGALPDRPPEPIRVADIGATRAAIGWRPTVDLDEGLRRTVAWYRDQLNVGAL